MPIVSDDLLSARFWAKVDKNGPVSEYCSGLGPCWEWKASKGHDGYGHIGVGGREDFRVVQSHRLSWELTAGPIPQGLLVLHRCHNRGCVNPGHLYLGTNADNVRDKIASGRQNTNRDQRHRIGGSLADRFWRLVTKTEDCWEWSGYLNGAGYGMIKDHQKHRRAHVVSWEIHRGSIPEGLCVLHTCDNRRCVRPEHLFLGTRTDNAADRTAKGRTAAGESNGARRHPENMLRGDLHPMRRNPQLAARGEQHGSHTHPESRTTGDDHWSRKYPERRPTGARHGSATHPEAVLRGEDCSWSKLTAEQVRAIKQEYASGGISQGALGLKYGISQTQIGRIIRGVRWPVT